jgi:dephospho-CoA kinase
MLKIGLTGGIASGKSSVAQLFKQLGTPVIEADLIARRLVEPGQALLSKLTAAFGPQILDEQGRLNRKRMRELIFADPQTKQRLEDLMHPAIYAQIEAELVAVAPAPYAVVDVPLLAESKADYRFDRIVVVDCPEELQRQRLIARDAIDEDLAERMIASQASREMRLRLADDVINNINSLELLAEAVKSLHNSYISLATVRIPSA